jgi:proteic killer suppression protein
MEVGFRQQRLAKIFNSERELIRKYGPEPAKRIMGRMLQLAAAHCLEDLRNMPGRCHELGHNRAGQVSIDLHGPYRLIFEPADAQDVSPGDGGLNWSAVKSVTILEITDTHET